MLKIPLDCHIKRNTTNQRGGISLNLHQLLNQFWTVVSQKQKLILAVFFVNLYVLIQKKLNLRLQLIVYYFIMLLEVFQYISGNILYVSVSSLKTLNNKSYY